MVGVERVLTFYQIEAEDARSIRKGRKASGVRWEGGPAHQRRGAEGQGSNGAREEGGSGESGKGGIGDGAKINFGLRISN